MIKISMQHFGGGSTKSSGGGGGGNAESTKSSGGGAKSNETKGLPTYIQNLKEPEKFETVGVLVPEVDGKRGQFVIRNMGKDGFQVKLNYLSDSTGGYWSMPNLSTFSSAKAAFPILYKRFVDHVTYYKTHKFTDQELRDLMNGL